MKKGDCMKAQVAIDLLIASVILFIIFLSVFGLYADRFQAAIETRQRLSASRVAELVAWNANTVLQSVNGTKTIVRLPSMLATGDSYSIRAVSRRIEVEWHNKTEARPLLTSLVSGAGALAPGKNVSITNVDGGIVFG